MFDNLKGKIKRNAKLLAGVPVNYEESKQLAQSADAADRQRLAEMDDVAPELLYFLAEDEAPEVRREIAANPSTPLQADVLLARDQDDEVRAQLAVKIGKAIPNLSPDHQEKLRDLALDVLEILVEDQLPRVRAILAEELKHTDNAPKHIIEKLAFDRELTVAGPILRYSPLLSDKDLLRIIASAPGEGALSYVARRERVAASVSDAIVKSSDVQAIAALLKNPGSQIREDALDQIVDRAAGVEIWHEPLVKRQELPPRLVKRVAGFVATSLVNILAERDDLDSETALELSMAIRKRLDGEETAEAEAQAAADNADVERMLSAGELDEEAIVEQIEMGQRSFVAHALAARAKLEMHIVDKIIRTKNARAVVALCWKADLSMRTALRVQKRIVNVPARQVINARNGIDYPFPEEDMELLLELF